MFTIIIIFLLILLIGFFDGDVIIRHNEKETNINEKIKIGFNKIKELFKSE